MTRTHPFSLQFNLLESEESALVRAVRQGDRGAARHLFERLYPVAQHAVLVRTRGSELAAEDLVQAILERVHKSIVSGAFGDQCRLLAWVRSIARITVTDAYRAAYREQRALDGYAYLACGSVDGEPHLEARGELRAVVARLSRMKPAYLNVVAATGVGMTVAEAADHTNATVVATQSRLRRARQTLWRGRYVDVQRSDLPSQPDVVAHG